MNRCVQAFAVACATYARSQDADAADATDIRSGDRARTPDAGID
jgi:hypothetical protein